MLCLCLRYMLLYLGLVVTGKPIYFAPSVSSVYSTGFVDTAEAERDGTSPGEAGRQTQFVVIKQC